jgi:hypothetical protein
VRNALIGMIQKEYAFPVTSSKLWHIKQF